MLNKDKILNKIRENRSTIVQKYHVKRLALFGSHARGEGRFSSDIDFVVEFDHKSFDAYMGLKNFLEELFNCRVDLVLPDVIKPRLRDRILGELVDAA
ncbi:MAG: nucleotidyltransferase family protein [Candidatus Omnitrophica bacterium]|nr:nucleotidyltransferase family protein [Candidatus Omnitrophota bacterium]